MARLFGITCTGLLLLSCLPLRLQAQDDRLTFERLSVEQGLSNAVVHAITQDRKGFLWIATEHGLNLYDGYRFTVYQHEPLDTLSIAASWVNDLFEDHTGTLWLDVYVPGLSRFDPETRHFIHYRHDPDEESLRPGLAFPSGAGNGAQQNWSTPSKRIEYPPTPGLDVGSEFHHSTSWFMVGW